MSLSLLETDDPSGDPVLSTADAKAWLRVSHDTEDATIAALVAAATRHVEELSGTALLLRTFTLYATDGDGILWDGGRRSVCLPRWPFGTLSEVEHGEAGGNLSTVDPSLYLLDDSALPARVELLTGFPTTGLGYRVRFTFTAGASSNAGRREELIQAVRMLAAHWFEHREAAMDGGQAAPVPFAVDALCRQVRVVWP